MKTALLLSYHFPPMRTVGAIRPSALHQHLPTYNWQLIPIHGTPQPTAIHKLLHISPDQNLTSQLTALRQKLHLPAPLINIPASLYSELLCYPDPFTRWQKSALETASLLITKDSPHIDAIISSGYPHCAHIAASQLATQFHIPWIADFRDLWTQNHAYPYSEIRKYIEQDLEQKTLSNASCLTTVSFQLAAQLCILHNKPIHTILTGFPLETLNDPPAPLFPRFTITYTGTIYPRYQSLDPFLSAIGYLLSTRLISPSQIDIRLYTPPDSKLQHTINSYGNPMSQTCRILPMLPHSDILQIQRQSHALLLLKWNDPRQSGIYTLKLFEYLAAKRPILASGTHSDCITSLLSETSAGYDCLSAMQLKQVILSLCNQYLSTHQLPSTSNPSILHYTHESLASQFADILNSLTKSY